METKIVEEKQNEVIGRSVLPANQKIGILMCAVVAAVANGFVPSYINLYYTDTVGISMGAIGMIMLLTKLTDGVSDIVMGMIIDRTNTKLGKARPWVLAGGIGLAISIVLLFNAPGSLSYAGKVAFCAAFFFLVNPFFGTMVSVAIGTMNNLLSGDSDNRAILGVFSAFGTMIPVFAIGLIVPPILSSMNESQSAYTLVSIFFAIATVIATLIGVYLVRETVTEHSKEALKDTKNQTVKETLKVLIKNKYFIYLAAGTILYNLSAAPVATYYAKYIFKDVGVTALLNLPGLLMVILIPVTIPLIKKFGKRNCITVGMLFAGLGHMLMFIANDNLAFFMIAKTISSLAVAPFSIALIPLTGEICDFVLYQEGKPMDGTISSAATMGGKIGIGLAAGVSSWMLAMSGYISTDVTETVNQPNSTLIMIRLLMSVIPALLFCSAAFCFSKIDLEKQGITQIQKELRERGLR